VANSKDNNESSTESLETSSPAIYKDRYTTLSRELLSPTATGRQAGKYKLQCLTRSRDLTSSKPVPEVQHLIGITIKGEPIVETSYPSHKLIIPSVPRRPSIWEKLQKQILLESDPTDTVENEMAQSPRDLSSPASRRGTLKRASLVPRPGTDPSKPRSLSIPHNQSYILGGQSRRDTAKKPKIITGLS
jgi:hypothetical protein